MPLERLIRFRVRTILAVLGLAIAVWGLLRVLSIARHVITWFLIALFLALALNPLVEWLQRRGIQRRARAVMLAYAIALLAIAGIGATFVPTLVRQVNHLVNATPGYVHDISNGKGRLGFLETKYHLKEKIEQQIKKGGTKRVLGLSGAAISITRSVLSIVAAIVTIAFMTYFMLLEGPAWLDRLYGLLPPESQPRWRAVGRDIYKAVGGYVTGNLLISLIAGGLTTIVLLIMGVPYSVALGLVVAILDLIPLAGATIAGVLIAAVSFLHSVPAGIVAVVFFIVYQQVENHYLQPVIYGRTVQLSQLAVLMAVLVGAELAGILGALGAIPVAGAIQAVLIDVMRVRRERAAAGRPPEPAVDT